MRPAASVILFMAIGAAAPMRSGPTEHDVKAAYVINILRFAERRSSAAAGDLTLCLFGAGLMEQPLVDLENSTVRGRKLKIRTIARSDIAGCEAIFFGRSSGAESALAKAQSLGILTIGNDSEFIPMSGMLALVVENRRIVVEVSQSAVRNQQWVLSSHLLEIARVIGGAVR